MRSLLREMSFVEKFLLRGSSFNDMAKEQEEEEEEEEEDNVAEDVVGSSSSRPRKWVHEFSALANVVASRCARILFSSLEEMQQQFDDLTMDYTNSSALYARHLLEYCCFRALSVSTRVTDHLSDKNFRQLTFWMMLAWEAPGAADKPAITVGSERVAGKQAFVRIAPAIAGAADSVSVHSQFDTLTATTEGRLTFTIYNKYITEVAKIMNFMKSQSRSSHLPKSLLAKGETVVEVEGTVTTPPVLQHEGFCTWPGRLTLTDHALYFESIGVGSYDYPKKFAFHDDLQPLVRPEVTGPWGARLFNKAILCRSHAFSEPLIFEFPEFTGNFRRDYWLAIICELIQAHHFVQKHQLEENDKDEILARAVLGIVRLQATRETIRGIPLKCESLLTFLTCKDLPGGDLVLKAIARTFFSCKKRVNGVFHRNPLAASVTKNLASPSVRIAGVETAAIWVGEFLIGNLNPVEKAVLKSRDSSMRAELAQSTISCAKINGIDTNFAVLKELLLPINLALEWMNALLSWNEPPKTLAFLFICSYIVLKDFCGYVVPVCLLCCAGLLLWVRQDSSANVGKLHVLAPSTLSGLEQLKTLQQALTDFEKNLKLGNISLLKVRAIFFSMFPQATDHVIAGLIIVALCLLLIPFKFLVLLVLWETFTRHTHLRKESTERIIRRAKEWWYRVPVVQIQFVKAAKMEDRKLSH